MGRKKNSLLTNPIVWSIFMIVLLVGGYLYYRVELDTNSASSSDSKQTSSVKKETITSPSITPKVTMENPTPLLEITVTPTPEVTRTLPSPTISGTGNNTPNRTQMSSEERFQYDVEQGFKLINAFECIKTYEKSVEKYKYDYGMLPNGTIEYHLYEKLDNGKKETYAKFEYNPTTSKLINQQTGSENICPTN